MARPGNGQTRKTIENAKGYWDDIHSYQGEPEDYDMTWREGIIVAPEEEHAVQQLEQAVQILSGALPFRPVMRPDTRRATRFDLNPPGHGNEELDLRSHMHLSSDDDGMSVPAPVMSPFELLDLMAHGLVKDRPHPSPGSGRASMMALARQTPRETHPGTFTWRQSAVLPGQ